MIPSFGSPLFKSSLYYTKNHWARKCQFLKSFDLKKVQKKNYFIINFLLITFLKLTQRGRRFVTTGWKIDQYSGDLYSELVWYSNGPKQLVLWMVRYSSHVLNGEQIVCYLNGKKFGNQKPFGYWTFYHGRLSNGPDHSNSDHLNTKQV